jgi:hypothetical protein
MIFEHSGHSLGLPSTIGSGLANSGGIDRVKENLGRFWPTWHCRPASHGAASR